MNLFNASCMAIELKINEVKNQHSLNPHQHGREIRKRKTNLLLLYVLLAKISWQAR